MVEYYPSWPQQSHDSVDGRVKDKDGNAALGVTLVRLSSPGWHKEFNGDLRELFKNAVPFVKLEDAL
jgi:hypothetical protein